MKKIMFLLSSFLLLFLLSACSKDETSMDEKEEKVTEENVEKQEIKKDEEEVKEDKENTKEKEIKKIEEEKKPELKIFKNGEVIDYKIKPIEKEKAVIVPLRETAEVLGWKVTWKSNRFVIVENKEHTIRFKIGESEFIKDDKLYPAGEVFLVEDGIVFIPIRAIAESMGAKVTYNKKEKTIDIKVEDKEIDIKEKEISVLVYHGLMPGRYDVTMIEPNRFKEQMTLLKENGYTTINEHDLLSYMKKEKNLPEKPILIHFDDGYEGIYTYAYPILKELNMQATAYLVGKTVKERTSDDEPYKTPHVSWEQVKEMYDSGVFEFQSHTFNAHSQNGVLDRLKNETDEKYKERLLNDFIKSKELIEGRLKNDVISLAYPVGYYNDIAIQNVKKAGYDMAFSMDEGKVRDGQSLYTLKRVYISGSDAGQSFIQKIENLR